jgi:hypothetical protein
MKTRFGAKDSLITNESGFVHQADSRKSRFDSVPKGQNMANAKSLRKRIALVAAAALGVGMLAAAPAFATAGTTVQSLAITAPVTAGAGGTSVPIPQGTAITASLTLTTATVTLAAADTISTAYVVTNPLGVAVTGAITAAAGPVGTNGVLTGGTTGTILLTATAGTVAPAGYVIGTLNLTTAQTAVPGIWTVVSTTTFTSAGNTNTPTELLGTTSVAAGQIYVSGTGVTQGTTRGQNGNATTSNAAAVTVHFPTHTAVAGGTQYKITSSGVGSITGAVQVTGTATAIVASSGTAGNWSAGVTYNTANATTTESFAVALASSVAGVQTITLSTVDPNTGLVTTVSTSTVTWGATAGTTYSYSTVGAAVLTGTSIAQEVSGVTLATAVTGTQAESWTVSQFDATGTAMAVASSAALTASLAGVGSVQINVVAITGGYAALAAGAANTGGFDTVKILSDGRAGTSTLTISVNGVVVATKSVTFYGGVATLTAVANKTVLAGAGAASLLAATITAKDANGTLVPFLTAGTFSAVSSSTTVLASSGTFAEDATTTYGGHGNYTATVTSGPLAVSGNTATITYTYTNATPTTFNAAPLTFNIGGSASTVTFAFDKTSYTPGAVAVITVTAKDSAGNPAASAVVVLANALVSNVGASGLPNAAALTSKNGTATLSVYAPATAGPWTVTDAANTVTGAAITASATVAGGTSGGLSAADSAAIAAAKASADAATAAVATLSTTVASLIASITAQIRALAAQIAKLLGKSGGTTPGLPKTGSKK